MTRREQQTDRTRTAIMEAASDFVFGTANPEEFTMQNVADAAGVSHRTLYRYFPSRRELINSIGPTIDDRFDDVLEKDPLESFDNWIGGVDQMVAFGATHVEFRKGQIEDIPIEGGTVDVIISNCVINLSADKPAVFAEMFRVLKPGGRMMISDLISVHPTPKFLLENTDALVGCLPVQEDEYLGKMRAAGLENVEIVEEKAYPNDLLSADPAVQEFLKAHPDEEQEILDFIASIRSGMIQGVKPTP